MQTTAIATDPGILDGLVDHAPATAAPAATKPRVVGIDRMRLVAAALMIQGHAFTLAVRPTIRGSSTYHWHDFVHGFTAPMFLFGAGLAFGVTAAKPSRDRDPDRTLLAVERYGTLILLSYLLHLGSTTLARLGMLAIETQRRLVAVDALACLGISLLVATVLRTNLRSVDRLRAITGAIGATIVLASPFFDRLDTSALPLPLASFVNHATGSLFPLFPWSGYVFVGIAASALVGADARRGASLRVVFGGLGVAAIGLGIGLRGVGSDWFGPHSFWQSSPFFFLVRCGVAMLVLALVAGPDAARGRSSSLMRRLTSETLCLYLVHLAILYGTPFTRGIRRHVEGRLDLAQATALALGLGLVSIVLALAFGAVKERHGTQVTLLRRVALVAIVVRFFAAG